MASLFSKLPTHQGGEAKDSGAEKCEDIRSFIDLHRLGNRQQILKQSRKNATVKIARGYIKKNLKHQIKKKTNQNKSCTQPTRVTFTDVAKNYFFTYAQQSSK